MKTISSFSEIKKDILNGDLSCTEVVNYYFDKIKTSKTNAVLEVFEESAMAKAKEVDQKIKEGNAGMLAGLVIGIKDNICYKGHKVSEY